MTYFWLDEPAILMKQDEILHVWPDKSMNKNEKLNAITRLVIVLTILGYVSTKNIKLVLSGIVSIIAVVILHQSERLKLFKDINIFSGKEGFANEKSYHHIQNNFTEPTKNNPLMNVLPHEIHENPNRKPAAPSFNPVVEDKINAATKEFVASNFDDPKIDEKLFKDLGDNFNFDQSMRAWHPMPNTQTPNDQKSFAEFCYGGMTSCKEGNSLACSQTADSRWVKG